MGSAAGVLRVAAGQIGYSEEGTSNRTKYAPAVGHTNGLAWCATYVVWCFKTAGVALPKGATTASTLTNYNAFKAAGKSFQNVADARPGDVVFFRFPSGPPRINHIGIVEANLGGGNFQVLEGNTNGAGSRTGGSVLRKVRVKDFAGFGRPDYDGKSVAVRSDPGGRATLRLGSKGPDVVYLQKALSVSPADGDFGPKTLAAVRAFQASKGLEPDGIVGAASWKGIG